MSLCVYVQNSKSDQMMEAPDQDMFTSDTSAHSSSDIRSQSSPVDYKGLQNRLYNLCLEGSITDCDSNGVMRFRSESQFRAAFMEMKSLMDTKTLCDVVLEVEGEKIHCHRVVLASLSSYFRAMFTGDMAESKQRVITINGVDAQSLRCLVDYAYTATIEISEKNVQAILPAASVLQFEEVKRACSRFLRRNLDTDNCLGIKMFAEVHGCEELQSAATVFSSCYFTQVQNVEEYLKLPFEEVKTFLSRDQLNVNSEFDVFRAAMAWLLQKDERRKHVHEILDLVRLPLLDTKELLTSVGRNPLVVHDPRCVKMLIDAMQCHILADSKAEIEPHRLRPRKPHRKLYAIGGWDGNTAVDMVECYDTETSQWETINSTHTARNGVGLAILDGLLYAIGGHDGQRFQSTVEVYDPRSKRWKIVTPLKHKRASAGVAVHDGYIYVIGGQDGTLRLRSVERYSPKTGEWEAMTSMNMRRDSPGVVTHKDSIYAIGGCHACTFLDTVERFDPKLNRWFSSIRMNHHRSAVGVVSIGNHMYVFGGHDEHNSLCVLERYDPDDNTWTTLSPMNSPRAGVGGALLDGKIVAVGGFDGVEQLGSVEQYDVERNVWSYMTAMKHERSYVGAISTIKII